MAPIAGLGLAVLLLLGLLVIGLSVFAALTDPLRRIGAGAALAWCARACWRLLAMGARALVLGRRRRVRRLRARTYWGASDDNDDWLNRT